MIVNLLLLPLLLCGSDSASPSIILECPDVCIILTDTERRQAHNYLEAAFNSDTPFPFSRGYCLPMPDIYFCFKEKNASLYKYFYRDKYVVSFIGNYARFYDRKSNFETRNVLVPMRPTIDFEDIETLEERYKKAYRIRQRNISFLKGLLRYEENKTSVLIKRLKNHSEQTMILLTDSNAEKFWRTINRHFESKNNKLMTQKQQYYDGCTYDVFVHVAALGFVRDRDFSLCNRAIVITRYNDKKTEVLSYDRYEIEGTEWLNELFDEK